MITDSSWRHCLIGSTFFHIGLFVLIKNMSPSTPVAMSAVSTFAVESCDVRLPETKRSPLPDNGTNVHTRAQGASQLQPIKHAVMAIHPFADPPSKDDTPNISLPQSVQGVTPTSTLAHNAPVSPLSSRPREENSGIKSIHSHQDQETGPVMKLGDAGSPCFIHRESPIYPFMARKLGKEGKVVLKLTLDAQGELQKIDAVEANGFGFTEAASEAIKKSKFAPAIKNGNTISSQVLVSVRFVLKEGH